MTGMHRCIHTLLPSGPPSLSSSLLRPFPSAFLPLLRLIKPIYRLLAAAFAAAAVAAALRSDPAPVHLVGFVLADRAVRRVRDHLAQQPQPHRRRHVAVPRQAPQPATLRQVPADVPWVCSVGFDVITNESITTKEVQASSGQLE